MDDRLHALARQCLLDRALVLAAGALAEEQGLHLQGKDHGDDNEQQADHRGAGGVPAALTGQQRHRDPEQCEHQAEERTAVLQQDDGQLGGLGGADELLPGAVPADVVRLDDGSPQRVSLHDHGHQKDRDGDPLPGVDRVRVGPLVPRLVQGEEATEAEQHDRHDEGVDVALAAVAEGMLGRRRALGSLAAEQQERLVAGVRQRVDRLREHR